MTILSEIEKFAIGGPRAGHGWRGIRIGLVNNMPDAGLRATELEFARLIKQASGAMEVELCLFSSREIARGETARSRMEGFYGETAQLPDAGMDGLIVAGSGGGLAPLLDWAQEGVIAALFSGLAVHDAVLHLDAIACRKLKTKLSGVYRVERLGEDRLHAGMNAHTQVPHSRREGLDERELTAKGYRILSRLAEGGVDSFTKAMRGGSQFLFLAGHPEYGPGRLAREYLDELGLCIGGERPAPPVHYFDRATELALAQLDEEGEGLQSGAIVSAARPLASWHGDSVRLFSNWLSLIAAEKMRRQAPAQRPRKRLRG